MQSPKAPIYANIIQDILAEVQGPFRVADLAAEILKRRPSTAKDPQQAALKKIREAVGRQLIYLGEDQVLPLRLAFQGVRYRIRLTKEEAEQAVLSIEKCFLHYLNTLIPFRDIRLIDVSGNPIQTEFVEVPRKLDILPLKQYEYNDPGLKIRTWFRSQKFYFRDHILVTVEDWEKGVFRLERERYGAQQPDLVIARNQLIADMAYEMLESARDEAIYLHVAMPTLYAKMQDKSGCPADHFIWIINDDPRMASDGWQVQYTDSGYSMIEEALDNRSKQSASNFMPFTETEGKQVYHLRAHLSRNPTIWREIEIQGKHTLSSLDRILRQTFQHDPSDHLSGFWKRVERSGGSRKSSRELDMGTINPFEESTASKTAVAELKLKVGDQLKYVYDFGDWVEHTLKVKSIGDADMEAAYPREVARNKPKYKYCIECQGRGKQTIATWQCYRYSEPDSEPVFLCEDCLYNSDEEYDAYDILY